MTDTYCMCYLYVFIPINDHWHIFDESVHVLTTQGHPKMLQPIIFHLNNGGHCWMILFIYDKAYSNYKYHCPFIELIFLL